MISTWAATIAANAACTGAAWRNSPARRMVRIRSALCSAWRRFARTSAASDLPFAEPGRLVRIWRQPQQLQRVRGVEFAVCRQRRRKGLPQRRTQPQNLAGPVPDQRLVSPSSHLHRLSQRGITSHLPMMGTVQPDDLSQDVRITGIGLRP